MKPIPSSLAAFIRGALDRYNWRSDPDLSAALTAHARPLVLSSIGRQRIRSIALRTEPMRRNRKAEAAARTQWIRTRRET